MRKVALLVAFAALVACKARKESSDAKSLIAVGDQGLVEIMFQPLDTPRLADASVESVTGNGLITRNVTEAATTADRPTPDFGAQNHLCFATCKSVPAEASAKAVAASIDCEATGYAEVDDVISAAGKMSEAAQERVLQALSTTEVLTSANDAAYKELKNGLATLIRNDAKKDVICAGKQDGGLSLTGDLFLSPICFRNKTGSTVRIDATVTYKRRGYRYLEDKTAYWTYPAGRESCLDVTGCDDNEDGLCKIGRIQYVASISGRSFQNNGAGIEFRSSRNTTDEHWINLTRGSSGSGSSGSSSSGSSSGNSSSNDSCLNALKEVYNNYGSGAFQSARNTEVSNCLGATQKTDWNNYRSHFYCQFPGQPVRQCFTYGAAALKQQGFSQSKAYAAMFQACKANGSFNSFSGHMMNNFEAVMTGDVGCSESSINSFYSWVGIRRPVR